MEGGRCERDGPRVCVCISGGRWRSGRFWVDDSETFTSQPPPSLQYLVELDVGPFVCVRARRVSIRMIPVCVRACACTCDSSSMISVCVCVCHHRVRVSVRVLLLSMSSVDAVERLSSVMHEKRARNRISPCEIAQPWRRRRCTTASLQVRVSNRGRFHASRNTYIA